MSALMRRDGLALAERYAPPAPAELSEDTARDLARLATAIVRLREAYAILDGLDLSDSVSEATADLHNKVLGRLCVETETERAYERLLGDW